MPPSPKFTKSEIAQAALRIISKKGVAALTAKELGNELGSSARPIFTTFQNVEEVWTETLAAARILFNQYVAKAFQGPRRFYNIGLQFFRFAKEEPRLFALLFMKEGTGNGISGILVPTYDNYEDILSHLEESSGLSRADSAKIFQTMFIFTHGLACLQATGASQFTEEDVGQRIMSLFSDVLAGVKRKQAYAALHTK